MAINITNNNPGILLMISSTVCLHSVMLGKQQHSRCECSLYKLAARQAERNIRRGIKLGSRHLALAGVECIMCSPP